MALDETIEHASVKNKCIELSKEQYNRAIDDFATKMKRYMETTEQATYIDEINKGNDNYSAMAIYDDIDKIAEQLKADVSNE